MLLFFLFIPFLAFGDNDELIELQLAGLTAERIHLQNVLLVGVDPDTCKNTGNSSLMLRQMVNISKSNLSHCTNEIREQMKSIDERIKNLEEGHLSFSPVKNDIVPLRLEPTNEVPSATTMSAADPSPEEDTTWPTLGPVAERVISPEAENRHQKMIDFYSTNKSSFEPREEDSLFERVSKGYIRNLHNMEPGN